MSHFPVTNSNLSAKHLASLLNEKYALSNDNHCQILKAGINDTYLVIDNDKKYIFRVYSFNWRTNEQIQEEIRFLNQLKENNLSISYPILDSKKKYIQTLNAPEGERFAVLFSYAEGEKQHLISEETHFKIGQLIGKLHQVSQNQKLNRAEYTAEVLLVDSLIELSAFLKDETEEMRFMKSAQSYLLNEIKNADLSQIRKGIVHLDIWFDNLNISNDGQATIFDFDFCGNGWLCLDVAYYIMQLHNVEKYEEKDYKPKVDSFMKGYESISPMSGEEKRLIPMLGVILYFFYLGIQCQRYDNWSNTFLNENYLKRFINGLVKRYFDIYKLGENENNE